MRNKKFAVEVMSTCDSVTGSQTLLVIHRDLLKHKILIDCGWNFELPQDRQRTISDTPDCVILTHAHTDHIACLPDLCKTFDGPVYSSKDTRVLIGTSLDDTLSIQRTAEKNQGIPILYSEKEIAKALDSMKVIENGKRFEVLENIFVTLIPNSHIPGSCCVYLEIYPPKYMEDKPYTIPPMRFFFTGDLKTKENPFLPDTIIPEHVLNEPVYIITESTYGEEGRTREKVFRKNILDAVKKKKKIIIPVISLGRAQLISLEIKRMKEKGEIPSELPVYFDGKLLFKYNSKFKNRLDVLIKDFEPEDIIYVDKTTRPNVSHSNSACIIISSSGNASFGPSNEYVSKNIENENALIHFTSFQPEGTLGRKLVENDSSTIEVNGSKLKINAEIEMTSEFSSHDEKKDLVKFIKSFKQVRGILVTHGEKEARESLMKTLEEEIPSAEIKNLDSTKFIRINRHEGGMMKEINSKFKQKCEIKKEAKNFKNSLSIKNRILRLRNKK